MHARNATEYISTYSKLATLTDKDCRVPILNKCSTVSDLPTMEQAMQTQTPIMPDSSSDTPKGLKFKVITDCKRKRKEENLAMVSAAE